MECRKFFRISSKFVFALFFLVQVNLQNNCFAMSENKGVIPLLEEMNSFLFKQILEQDFLQEQDRLLALYLKYELVTKYELIKNDNDNEIEFLKLLIEWQKIAQSKLDIILAKDEAFLNEYEIKSINLNILNKLYSIVQKYWKALISKKIDLKKIKDTVNDKFITDLVRGSLPKKLNLEIVELLKIDFQGFWKELYSKYKSIIEQYRANKNNLTAIDATFEENLETLIKILSAQKATLEKINFVEGWNKILKQILGRLGGKVGKLSVEQFVDLENTKNLIFDGGYYDSSRKCLEEQLKNSLQFFHILILKLLKIKNEIKEAKSLWLTLSNLNPAKKEIMLKHLILTSDEDIKNGKFSTHFNRYQCLIEEFLNKDKMVENFSYRLDQNLYYLKKLKNIVEAKGSLYSLGILKDSNAINSSFLVEQMIAILESIAKDLKAEKEGLLGQGEQFFEQLVNGEIKIPEKLKRVVGAFIQTVIGT